MSVHLCCAAKAYATPTAVSDVWFLVNHCVPLTQHGNSVLRKAASKELTA